MRAIRCACRKMEACVKRGFKHMIRIGTRGSKLALKQAVLVREALLRVNGQIETEFVILRTRGDRVQDRAISELGGQGVFASELEQALSSGQIDLAVHSAKDLPMNLAGGLLISAVLPRADVRDVLVVPRGGRTPFSLGDTVPFIIGSGSRRRQMFAGKAWEHVVCKDIRGNVDTRLGRLKEGSYDGILLAQAGLDRLDLDPEQAEAFDFYPLSTELFLPAACQGIIAVEAVQGSAAAEISRKITDVDTELCYQIEREVLKRLSADCSEAVAVWCRRAEAGQGNEIVNSIGGHRQATDSLVLDVAYADRRVSLTCPAKLEEGRQMAQRAAKMVKA